MVLMVALSPPAGGSNGRRPERSRRMLMECSRETKILNSSTIILVFHPFSYFSLMKLFKSLFLVIAFSIIACGTLNAQKRGNVWCFGHHAAIDFNGPIPLNDTSALISRGSCASICDTSGQLLFYVGYDDDIYSTFGPPYQNGEIFNSNHTTMENGDTVVMIGWYYETVIVPHPGNDSLYFVFSTNVTGNSIKGLYYSLVNIKANNGLGSVIQKNVQLQNFKTLDCLTAIKHGNGRDWWVFNRKREDVSGNSNDEYYSYLISPTGISTVNIQHIGWQVISGFGNIEFNSDGSKMMYSNLGGLMELFDFNRCNGLLSNVQNIYQEEPFTLKRFWDGQFSPSGRYFYVTTSWDTSRLIQYDLQAANIALSADTLWQTNTNINQFGHLKLAPDGKIYLSTYYNGTQFPYPYTDTMYTTYNTYLSVINQPDSAGTTCDFQPYSFYLGGKRTYFGLPNNPDYDLPALAGCSCDTLVSIGEVPQIQQAVLNVFYHTAWEKAFINASNLRGKTGKLLVYDMQGKVVHSEPLQIQNGFYTRDLSMIGYAEGMYLITIQTEKERLTKKVMVE